MINLLPTNQKQANSYGLSNRILVRWIAAFCVGVIGIWAIIGFGILQLNSSISSQQQQIANAEHRLEDQDLEGIRAQTENIDNSIKLALQVIEKKILTSKLIQRIGTVMPENSILFGISLEDVEGGINLTARSTNHQSATQIQINLSDQENNVFTQVDIQSITCKTDTSPGTLEYRYPCIVNLRALFGDSNPFLFINQGEEMIDEQ